MVVNQLIPLFKNFLTIFIVFIFGFASGIIAYFFLFPPFNLIPLEKMPAKINDYLHIAIEKAEKAGVYNCCVEPSCTMCFWKEIYGIIKRQADAIAQILSAMVKNHVLSVRKF